MYTKTDTKLYATDYKCFKSNFVRSVAVFWLLNLHKMYFFLGLSQRNNLLLRLLLPATISQSGSAACAVILKQQNFKRQDERLDSLAISGCHIGQVHVTKLSRATMHSDIHFQLK